MPAADPSPQPAPDTPRPLSPELREQIQAIYDVLGPYLNLSLAEFEAGFGQDEDPEEDVELWLEITAVWIDYHETWLEDVVMSAPDERKLLSALIAISTGADDPASLGVPKKIGQQLLDCYTRFEEELDQALDED